MIWSSQGRSSVIPANSKIMATEWGQQKVEIQRLYVGNVSSIFPTRFRKKVG